MATLLDRALALASHGLRVFPLAPGQKVPALELNWRKIATADAERIRALWTDPVTGWVQPYNIGVALPDDILVVDVDVRDGRRGAETLQMLEAIYDPLPSTYRVRTPSKGDHHYFRVRRDAGPWAKTLGENVDLKTTGGFVVGEGSIVDGRAYTAAVGSPDNLSVFPADWLPIAQRSGSTNPTNASEVLVEPDSDSAVQRATEWLEHSAPIALEGDSGDLTTFRVAARVMDFGLSADATREAMLDHWNDRCQPPWDPEELAVKVENASRYRQSPVGVAAPEAEFDAVEVADRRTKPMRPRLYYETMPQVVFAKESVALIDDWYDAGSMVVTYGESGSGKTHIVLGQAMAIAAGVEWAGKATRKGAVIYVAAEGGRGIRKRVVAWRERLGGAIPFALVPCPIDLWRTPGDTKPLIELIRQAESELGQRCVMVVIDTLSRAMAGGNENAPDDMGAIVAHCDQIRAAIGCCLHLVHHSGKNKAAGARGHSLLRAATDTEIEVAEGTITATKQRDMDPGRPLAFSLEEVRLGTDGRGRPITTALPVVTAVSEFEVKLTEGQLAALSTLEDLVRRKSGHLEGELSAEMAAGHLVGSRQWKTALNVVKGDKTADKRFERDTKALVIACEIEEVEAAGRETMWRLTPPPRQMGLSGSDDDSDEPRQSDMSE